MSMPPPYEVPDCPSCGYGWTVRYGSPFAKLLRAKAKLLHPKNDSILCHNCRRVWEVMTSKKAKTS